MAGSSETTRTVRRRGLIAGAATMVAGIAAKRVAAPVGAFNALLMETTNTATSSRTSMNVAAGFSDSSVLEVLATGSTATVIRIDAISATGKYNGNGLSATGGNAVGFPGVSGIGVSAHGGTGGTFGATVVNGGNGVSALGGDGGNPGGSGGHGVSTSGGNASSAGKNGGNGVFAIAGSGGVNAGVLGINFNPAAGNTGVTGSAVGSGIGVSGTATSGTGVYGQTNAANQYGVLGTTFAANSTAVAGTCTGNGSSAFSGGTTNPAAFAAFFQGTTVVQGNFAVTGSKSAVIQHPRTGDHRLVYCVESPDAWFEDFGEGTLTAGKASVALDPDFAALIRTDGYHVFLTEQDTHQHLIVTQRSASGFVVEADGEIARLKGKQANEVTGRFSWRVVGKRADIKSERLGKFVMPNLPLPDPTQFKAPDLPTPALSPKKP